MNFHYKETQRISYILPLVCMILFGIYSLYLFVHYQADILALTHYMQSSVSANSHSFDYTSYPVWTSAFLGTVLCVIPAIILYCCVRFPLRMKALALFPSYVVLTYWDEIPAGSHSLSLLSSFGVSFWMYTYFIREEKNDPGGGGVTNSPKFVGQMS